MKIARLQVTNFRSFDSLDLILEGESKFVIAENAGGKTSLLLAITRALGRDHNFLVSDYRDTSRPILLAVTLSDLSESDLSTFADNASFSGSPTLEMGVRATWSQAAGESDVDFTFGPRHERRVRRDERDAIPFIWLPTTRSPERQLALGGPNTIFGQLLADLPLEEATNEAIHRIAEVAALFAANDHIALLLEQAGIRLGQLLPDIAASAFSLGPLAISEQDLLQQLQLLLAHITLALPVGSQSSGLAQLALFSFVMRLVDGMPGAIVLIDEPELSLHPQAQRSLAHQLEALGVQLLMATHSANILDHVDPRKILRLVRPAGQVEIVTPRNLNVTEAL